MILGNKPVTKVELLPNSDARCCTHDVSYVEKRVSCRRYGRILLDGRVYCMQHAGAILLQEAIDRGSM